MTEQKHITAMRLLVEFRKLKDLCDARIGRTKCEGCPFFPRKVCDMQSTDSVMASAANVFSEYLAGYDQEA